MKQSTKIGLLIIAALCVLGTFVFMGIALSVYNIRNVLNDNYVNYQSGVSQYSRALDTNSPKIKAVWAATQQYMDHESKTFKEYAQARSGFDAAVEAFQSAEKAGNINDLAKLGQQAMAAALNFKVQVESNPQLVSIGIARDNVRNMEESINHIDMALGDMIHYARVYNKYRGSNWPSIWCGGFGLYSEFPSSIPFYEGDIKKIDIDALNPQNKS